ncbi:hypothetical protein A6S26_30990 [Nostoc sp. ATCC 43529]|jgi:manganese transport protein|nr:hypothetical protein A6S26_30990 [Nostoc sp. ATCC 43529]
MGYHNFPRLIGILFSCKSLIIFGEHSTSRLIVLSQVILSLQLPFAVIPLVMFTSNRRLMGEFVNPLWLKSLAWLVAIIIVGLNVWLLLQSILIWLGFNL